MLSLLLNLRTRYKIIFWLTVALLLLFTVIPRGYAQALEGSSTPSDGTSSIAAGTSSPPSSDASGTTTPASSANTGTTSEAAPAAGTTSPPVAAPAPAAAGTSTPPTPVTSEFPYKKTFLITSYYSPLPDQTHFAQGNYDAEIRMEGGGVHGADGTAVSPGIAAASREVPFGTKMDIPNFGIVAIHDRGGAIKGDHLDLWVGKGEEGLRRSLGWGVRRLEVTVYGINPDIKEEIHLENVPLASDAVLASLRQRAQYFTENLGQGDSGDEVKLMQSFFKKIGYYDGDISENFDANMTAAVTKFQLEKSIIPNTSDSGTGIFGPHTRYTLEAELQKKKISLLDKLSLNSLKPGDSGDEVKNLQDVLKEFGYQNLANSQFDEVTQNALVRFQIEHGVIAQKSEAGAGFYGPHTRDVLTSFITDFFTPHAAPALVAVHATIEDKPKAVFLKDLALNDNGKDVRRLQTELIGLNFLGVEATGHFGKITEHAVTKFQQAMNIAGGSAEGAGVVGPRTREALNSLIAARAQQQKLVADATEQHQIILLRIAGEKKLVAGIVLAETLPVEITYGQRGDDIENLQKILKRLGFFPGKLTTKYFGDVTKSALTAFQKNHGLEATGTLDADTRKMFSNLLTNNQG